MTTSGALCMGYGGLDLAVEWHYDAETTWAAELDPKASEVIVARWPGVVNLGDLTTVDWAQVEPVDVLTAGYPCQPFSQAGRRKGTDDPRHLWPYIARAISVLRPRRVVLENVRGHLSLGAAAVLGDLAALGYDAQWGLVRASHAGAPHQRERLFIVAAPAVPDTHGAGRQGGHRLPATSRGAGPLPGRVSTAAHPHCHPEPQPHLRPIEPGQRAPRRCDARGLGLADHRLGPFQPAVDRWAQLLGRPAPAPLVGRQLSAPFVEWLMGLDAGWVTDVLPNRAALKVLGNGVVPQQAALALALLDPQEAAA